VSRAGQCAGVVYYVGDVSGLRLSIWSIVGWNLDYALGPVEELSGPSKTMSLTVLPSSAGYPTA